MHHPRGRNVTTNSAINIFNGHYIMFRNTNRKLDRVTFVDHEKHSHMPFTAALTKVLNVK